MQYELNKQDYLAYLKSIQDNSIDCIIVDPAYESLEKHRRIGTTTRLSHSESSSNDWFSVIPNSAYDEMLAECYRVLNNDTHMYLLCDQETMFHIKPAAEKAGFKWWKGIVWNKERIGMGYHYRCQHEMICFLEKGKRNLNDLSIPDVLSVKGIRSKDAYPTEKPVELLEILVKQSTNKGETILDFFCGSGSALEAALKNDRNAIGVDISDASHERTTNRLENLNYKESILSTPRIQQQLFA